MLKIKIIITELLCSTMQPYNDASIQRRGYNKVNSYIEYLINSGWNYIDSKNMG